MIEILPFRQSDGSRCGPAVIKMILLYYGIDRTEDDICTACNWTYELGCTNEQMKSAIESYGLGCELYENGTLEDLEYWIRHHVPVIVDWFSPGILPGLSDMPNGHASIVVGIDRESVYLLDPEFGGTRSIPRDDFMRCWFDWREDPHLQRCNDLALQNYMIVYPKRLNP